MHHIQSAEKADVPHELDVDRSDEWFEEDFEDATSFAMTYGYADLNDD